jgi:hypothetical protein
MLGILRRVFSFSDWYSGHPGSPPPGDMLDASFDAQDNKINELSVLVDSVLRSDGVIRNAAVSRDSLAPDVLPFLVDKIALQVKTSAESAESAASEALSAGIQARNAAGMAESAKTAAESAQLQILDAKNAVLGQILAIKSRTEEIFAAVTATEADLLTMDEDWQTSRAEAEAWARSSALWAEHMPDTLPDNAVKIMDISGDHWSSRWWANRADNAFGRLTDLYLGAWADPPTTNLEGGPIETGSIYYDTDDGQPYVWDGNSWVPFWSPGRSVSTSLWYRATAGQTVFPFSVPDQNGNTFTFNATHPEGSEVYLNGIRLTPNYGSSAEADYSINTSTSTLTMLRPLRLGDIVGVTLLLPPEKLAPGAVTIWSLKTTPAVPDGTAVNFVLATKAAGGPAVNITKSEELLVSLDGVIQEPAFSYTATAGTLTFVSPPESTSRLFVTWYQSTAGGA